MSAAAGPAVKIHLILYGYALCQTPQREGGYQNVTTLRLFKTLLDDERCERCAVALSRLCPIPATAPGFNGRQIKDDSV